MKPIPRNDDVRDNRVLSQFAAQKKKTFIALCLIGVMAFMWVRVLGKKTLQPAEATLRSTEVSSEGQLNSQLKITFIELPKVAGRNDVLTRDFFAVKGWKNFMREREGVNLAGSEEGNIFSRGGSEEVVRRIAEKLQLEAICLGENSQAFINDKLLSVGDKLLVTEGVNKYECEVLGIEETEVFIRCGEAQIKLRLTTDD